MKKISRFLVVIFASLFILSGCNQRTKSTTQGPNIVGKTFSANTPVENATNGKMTIHFVNAKKAIIIESGKYATDNNQWGQLVFDANYKVLKNKTVRFRSTRGITETYKNKKALDSHETPIFLLSEKIEKDRDIGGTLHIGKDYLGDSKDKKSRLTLVKGENISSYDSYLRAVNKKYYEKDTKLSNRGFMSPATELLANGIAFKGSRFIWKYGGPDKTFATDKEEGARFAVFMGKYKLNGNKLTLFLQYHTSIYQGTVSQLSNKQYQDKLLGNDIPKKLVFKFTKNNKLHLITKFNDFKSDDMFDYGTVSGTPNYGKWSVSEQPDVYNVAMEKAEKVTQFNESTEPIEDESADTDSTEESVEKTFPTKEDFANWVTDYYYNQGDYATEDEPGFHVTASSAGGTENLRDTIDGQQSETPLVYSVAYSITTLADSDMDIARTISITSDGKIYSGHFNTLDNNLTQAYADYVQN
ncbi:hypothetical protein D1B17_06140 [Companilactobacillus zhachilii]|uniref:Lipoprotein n=1 Tax=Companilactobacillus zhachilii TaxID=2304606 RepID=A0A386PS39_9LACO|nr:hypothetical protein [Companilactobacillus zhachilii]AYE38232.2 hypothetical protein D1B17_06140 [Companilactobacillus zhachilii]